MPVIPIPRLLKQEDCNKFKANLDYIQQDLVRTNDKLI